MKRALVLCDGADGRGVPDPAPSTVDSLGHRGPHANISLGGTSEAAQLIHSASDRVADLVRVGAYALAADQRVTRGRIDPFGDEWKRDLHLCLPVHDLAFWQAPNVQQVLTDALGFLSGDRWTFYFSQAIAEAHQRRLAGDLRSDLGEPDCVVLFSGGLDSLCAAIDAANAQDRRPLLLSRSPAFDVKHEQDVLLAELRQSLPRPWHYPALTFPVHRTDGEELREYSQRSRSFLFAALGAAVAERLDLTDVVLADNGVVSLNLAINEQLLGTKASRSTHPGFLWRFNDLLRLVVGDRITVRNPLHDQTRQETFRILDRADVHRLIPFTLSCAHTRLRPASQPHCGTCTQCVDRRFATVAAELEQYDPASRYGTDIFRHALPAGRDRVAAVSYLEFARDVADIGPLELFQRRSMLYLAVRPTDPRQSDTARRYVDLINRHGREVLGVLEKMTRRYASELVQQTLPQHALLRLWIAGGTRPIDAAAELANSTVTAAPEPPSFVFRQQGDYWRLTFEGHETLLKDTRGLQYIHFLLEHERSEVPAAVLASVATGRGRRGADGRGAVETAAAVEAGLTVRSGLDAGIEVLDSETFKQYQERLQELEPLIQEADRNHDTGMKARYQDEFEQITDQMTKAAGFGGRVRRAHAPAENARTAVWQALNGVYGKLRRTDPGFVRFLQASISTGSLCVYRPVRPIAWEL